MRTSSQGVLEICEHEGIVPAPYLDSVGVWTWGVGHTAAAGGPEPKEMSRAMPSTDAAINSALILAVKQFAVDLVSYEDGVNQAVRVPLEQHEFDALVSFHFNTGGIHRANLTKSLNAGDPDASEGFMGWLKPPEIKGRRTAEMRLFETGDYDANGTAIPVWGTDGKGKLTKPIRNVDGGWILEQMGMAAAPKQVKVPGAARAVIVDADKHPVKSTTNWAVVTGMLTAGWQAWQSADPMVQVASIGLIAVLLYIFSERIRKSKLAKQAMNALGL